MSSGFLHRRSTTALGFIHVSKRSYSNAAAGGGGALFLRRRRLAKVLGCEAVALKLAESPLMRGIYNRISVLLQAGVRGVRGGRG